MSRYPQELLKLIAFFKKFPGVGSKTAERFAFQLLQWSQDEVDQFAGTISNILENIIPCPDCGCLMDQSQTEAICLFCDPAKRDSSSLCIVASPKDVYAFEETRSHSGFYHVIGALLSPLDGATPEKLQLHKLKERAGRLGVKEAIIALDSTVEGDATALYIKEELKALNISVSRLAFGLPMGSTLDYVDGGTLARALSGRQCF